MDVTNVSPVKWRALCTTIPNVRPSHFTGPPVPSMTTLDTMVTGVWRPSLVPVRGYSGVVAGTVSSIFRIPPLPLTSSLSYHFLSHIPHTLLFFNSIPLLPFSTYYFSPLSPIIIFTPTSLLLSLPYFYKQNTKKHPLP